MILFLFLLLASSIKAQSNGGLKSPPFDNLSHNHSFSDLIRSSDPTAFKAITYKGQHNREMFSGITNKVYIFIVDFKDGLTTEIQVKSQFGSSQYAQIEAEKYAIVIGRIPTILRLYVKRVVISKGNEYAFAFGKRRYIHFQWWR